MGLVARNKDEMMMMMMMMTVAVASQYEAF